MSTNQSTWSKLRWPIKAIIIAVPLIAIVWFATQQGWLHTEAGQETTTGWQSGSTTTTTANSNADRSNEGDGPKGTDEGTTASGERRSFAFIPEKPVNPVRRGVVEVGASGFNSFVVDMDAQKRWAIVTKDFGESLVYEGLATTDDIRLGLKKCLAKMFDNGVQNRNMHFVISSGAQKEPKTAGIVSELKKMGYVVNQVTPEQEGKLALKAALPPQYQDNSFMADIGSGNTKISWMEGGSMRALELPGAKYYEKGMADDAVYSDVKSKASTVPKDKREVCFILGGVPFELAKKIRHGEERYTVLNPPSAYKADNKKIGSGLNIYKGLVDATGCDTFVFDWDANFTIGFLLGL